GGGAQPAGQAEPGQAESAHLQQVTAGDGHLAFSFCFWTSTTSSFSFPATLAQAMSSEPSDILMCVPSTYTWSQVGSTLTHCLPSWTSAQACQPNSGLCALTNATPPTSRAGRPRARASATNNSVCSVQSPERWSSTVRASLALEEYDFFRLRYTQRDSRVATFSGSFSLPASFLARLRTFSSSDWMRVVAFR